MSIPRNRESKKETTFQPFLSTFLVLLGSTVVWEVLSVGAGGAHHVVHGGRGDRK